MSIFEAARTGKKTIEQGASPSKSESIFAAARRLPKPESVILSDDDDTAMKRLRSTIQKTGKDVLKQSAKEGITGLTGTYGDILDLARLQPKQMLPGEKSQRDVESSILGRLNEPGYRPSAGEIETLSEQEPIPRYSKLPSSSDVQKFQQQVGINPEAETALGRGAGRAARIFGSGLAFGQVNPISSVAAGSAGQVAEELGGNPLATAAVEILTLIATQGKSAGSVLNSTNKAVQDRISNLRSLGYSDQDITLAISSAKKNKVTTKTAARTRKAEEAFSNAQQTSERLVNQTLSKSFPGFEEGIESVKQNASKLFDDVIQSGKQIPIKGQNSFIKKANQVIDELENTSTSFMGSEKNAIIKELKDSLEKLSAKSHLDPTTLTNKTTFANASDYVDVYQKFNRMGRWLDPSKRERLLGELKSSVKNSFKEQGSAGENLVSQFEEANKGWQRYLHAEDVSEMLKKATSNDALDFNKLYKLFDKQSNWTVLQKGLGEQQARNLKEIAKTGRDIGDLSKTLGKFRTPFTGVLQTAKGTLFFDSLIHGDIKRAALFLGAQIGVEGMQRIATKMLIDPKYQTNIIRFLHAVKKSSPQSIQRAANGIQESLEEEGIDFSNL